MGKRSSGGGGRGGGGPAAPAGGHAAVRPLQALAEWDDRVCGNRYSEHDILRFLLEYFDALVSSSEVVGSDTLLFAVRTSLMVVACAIGAVTTLVLKFPAHRRWILAAVALYFLVMGLLQLVDTYWVSPGAVSFFEDGARHVLEPSLLREGNQLQLTLRRLSPTAPPREVKLVNYLGRYFHEDGMLHQKTALVDVNAVREEIRKPAPADIARPKFEKEHDE